MTLFLLSFLASALVGLLIVRYQHLHGRITGDHDLLGIQKFHARVAPRIGGLAVFIGLFVGLTTRAWIDQGVWKLAIILLATAIPAFLTGFIEDLTKSVSVRLRLAATFFSAALAGYFLNAWIVNVQIIGLDWLLNIYWVSIFFTCFAVAGLSNAFNIIDGYNGLASGVALMILGALGYVGFVVQDYLIMAGSLAGMGAILGFLVWNYPRGLLFMGDGGAYLLGFWIGELSILLVTRNPQVSKWFPVLICIYPIFETLFTVYRRLILKKTSAGQPDAVHLHQIIFRRMVRYATGSIDVILLTQRNSLTSPYLWILCAMSVIPAILFWQNHWILKFFVLLFLVSYIWIYWAIVKFKIPKWMIVRGHQK
jgi:UDP-N-acetylmuramyl pentapeptide phosphotransferase/UDP-N-acetylglucosamine-1-phosphate transferase